MKNKITRSGGFTLVEIMIVVAIIGLLAAIAIPNYQRSRNAAQMNACISNLRYIDESKQQWALESHKQDADVPAASDLQPYLGRTTAGELPSCPLDGAQTFTTSYSPLSVGEKTLCLISPLKHILP